ncbi:MAG TPA: hypothetical protein VFA77_10855, partial [Candidatus Eisenbacteria bacterium]|nr:hypothetical protein [Candidatus Eisenbacteria bacterium]
MLSNLKFRSLAFSLAILALSAQAQSLINIDFGVGSHSSKVGFAATGQSTNDYWNLYRHYDPKFAPGTPLVANGLLAGLKLSEGTPTKAALSVTNAPGVWGNATGDPMYDTYIFSQNGSNITVAVSQLDPGRYHFYLYGHADPDATGEQNSVFALKSGTNTFGPFTTLGSAGWKTTSLWQERYQFVVFRDVEVFEGQPVIIDAAPGANGVAVLNGLQIISRGTSPPQLLPTLALKPPSALTNLMFREIRYDGKVTDHEARFTVDLQVESLTTNEISAPLFDGEVAVMASEIPDGLRIVSAAKRYRLFVTKPGAYRFKLDLVAKIKRAEPWNQISLVGPNAAIASVTAQAAEAGVEMQLLSGTQLESEQKATSRLQGFLGVDRTLSMRWQSKAAEVARKSLVTVDTAASAQITPTVIKFTTQLRYEILQAPVPKLTIALPSTHALTKLQGDQIRDWQVKPDGNRQLLTIEFIKPVERTYALTLYSEQSVDPTASTTPLIPPQPLDIERETGSFNVSADDMLVETDSATGLRQVNAPAGTLAAYRFYGRPFALVTRLKRIEPVLKVADRLTARMEETRLLVSHALTLVVEKAGIYSVEFAPQTNFVVADVRGEGVEDWKLADGKVKVNFSSRLLGTHQIEVQLEQAHKTFPTNITVAALRATAATNETAQVGAASAPGIRLKTAGDLAGLREIPITALSGRSDELLAFASEQADWRLTLAPERLPARVVAEVFNLITIGDGLVGGSATIRYGLINQGVQEFKVKLPAHWKNVEFTGANIRRRDSTNDVWTIGLQDKAWGGYTLVITYDYQFDPKKATNDLSGAHALNVERETGSVAVTSAASLELKVKSASDPLRFVDQTELAETDRTLITRPVLLAYHYTGDNFQLTAEVTRHEEEKVLDAVADRTQLTSVLTEEGQMLTQASFMVKNNDRQFQKFKLPAGAELWACYVNNRPVKAERDDAWLLVSLPRGADRDEAFAVDLVYKQTLGAFDAKLFPKSVQLAAPSTDVPNTYAEWQLYVPPTQRLSGFGGNMTVLRGTTYGLRDAWQRCVSFYERVLTESGGTIAVVGGLAVLLIVMIGSVIRHGKRGVLEALVVLCILAILSGMLLPALGRAKAKAQKITAMNNLKQIALSARLWANDNGDALPPSFEAMMNELSTEKVLIDPDTGHRIIYVGAGKKADDSNALVAYTPDGRLACFADGSVRQMTSVEFAEAVQRDALVASRSANKEMAQLQNEVVRQQQERTALSGRERVQISGQPSIDPATGLPVPANKPPESSTITLTGLTTNAIAAPATMPMMMRRYAQVGAGGGGGFGGGGGGPINAGADGRGFLGAVGGANGAVAAAAGDISGAGGPLATPSSAAPTIAGIRSIRIDIPRTGQVFHFTKVLHVIDEPLSVKISAMKLKAFQIWRSVWQLVAFLAGLLIVWRQWRRPPANSFWITVGLALVIGSVTSLLIALRLLHVALIAALPVSVFVALACWAWRFWTRRKAAAASSASVENGSPEAGPASPGTSGAVAALALSVFLSQASSALAQPSADQASASNPKSEIRNPKFENTVSIVSADYTGRVSERVAQFDAVIRITTFATNQIVTLFGNDVAIQEFFTDAKEVKVMQQGNSVALRLPDLGSVTARFKLIAKLSGDVSKRQLAFGIPPALSSKLGMTIAEAEADVEFPTAIAFQRTPDKKETSVEAIL